MADVQIHFLDPINDYLGKPHFAGQTAAKLRGFEDLSEEALRAAAEKVIQNMTGTPKLATLQKALRDRQISVAVPMRSGPNPWDFDEIERLHYAKRKQACFMCRCNLGRRADKEGWLAAMVDFAYDNGRIPEGREIDRCIALAKRTDHAIADAVKDGLHSKQAERIAFLESVGREVFGDEAIKRTSPAPALSRSQGRRAGTDHIERQQANKRLKQLEEDYEPLSASPLLKKALGLPTRGRTERKFEQGIDGSE